MPNSLKNSKSSFSLQKFEAIYSLLEGKRRIKFYSDYTQIWDLVCRYNKKFVAFQSVTLKTDNFTKCRLDPVGNSYYETLIVSGIVKDFKHKNYIDRGFVDLMYFYGLRKIQLLL